VASKAVKKAGVHRSSPTLVTIPLLDDIRYRILLWVDELEERGPSRVMKPMAETHAGLLRVRGSVRHLRLAEFLGYTITALENGQSDSARYILLTGLAALGWPAERPR
jgi:hypothetical protein